MCFLNTFNMSKLTCEKQEVVDSSILTLEGFHTDE